MLITQIRKLCSCDELNIEAILRETELVEILSRFLSFSVDDDITYGMKLEAYWTLTNLCLTDDPYLLQEILGSISSSNNIINAMENDFKRLKGN